MSRGRPGQGGGQDSSAFGFGQGEQGGRGEQGASDGQGLGTNETSSGQSGGGSF